MVSHSPSTTSAARNPTRGPTRSSAASNAAQSSAAITPRDAPGRHGPIINPATTNTAYQRLARVENIYLETRQPHGIMAEPSFVFHAGTHPVYSCDRSVQVTSRSGYPVDNGAFIALEGFVVLSLGFQPRNSAVLASHARSIHSP